MYKLIFKRVFDFFVSILLLILLLPVIVVIIFVQMLIYHGQVLFLQNRPGKNEKPFNVIKFETMNDQKDDNGNLLPDHLRTTIVGAFLRKTSLDEIPQLINILHDEMRINFSTL